MSQLRDEMIVALKRVVVPVLRDRGFSGSLPHLRRRMPQQIDLMTFQFDKWGGGFVLEIAQCPPEGMTTYWGKTIAPNKVTAWDRDPNQRLRLQPWPGPGTDCWFRFDLGNTDVVAQSVLPFLEQAETWFTTGTPPENHGAI